MNWKQHLICVLLAAPWSLAHAEPVYGPVIEGYGPVYKMADRDVTLPTNMVFNVVFDATASAPGSPDEPNVELVSVARFINMHGLNGFSMDNMNLAVVLHGPALAAVLTDSAYREQFGMANPNLELLEKLHDTGVRFFACGQSMSFRGYVKRDLDASIKVALSAMTMLASLQADGYALLP